MNTNNPIILQNHYQLNKTPKGKGSISTVENIDTIIILDDSPEKQGGEVVKVEVAQIHIEDASNVKDEKTVEIIEITDIVLSPKKTHKQEVSITIIDPKPKDIEEISDTSEDLDDMISKIGSTVKKHKLENGLSRILTSTSYGDPTELTPFRPIRGTDGGLTDTIAIDCEMVIVSGGGKALARCSIVNYNGHVLFDKLIKPDKKVLNYLTFVSGIKEKDLQDAEHYDKYKKEILDILEGRIVVGHSIRNDFDALMYYPPDKYVRDIAYCKSFRIDNKVQSLKVLVNDHLKMTIQGGQHNPVEDARATMALYRKVEGKWDEEIENRIFTKNSSSSKKKY